VIFSCTAWDEKRKVINLIRAGERKKKGWFKYLIDGERKIQRLSKWHGDEREKRRGPKEHLTFSPSAQWGRGGESYVRETRLVEKEGRGGSPDARPHFNNPRRKRH